MRRFTTNDGLKKRRKREAVVDFLFSESRIRSWSVRSPLMCRYTRAYV